MDEYDAFLDLDSGTSGASSSPQWGSYAQAGGSIMSGIGDLMAGEEQNQAYQYNASLLDQQADEIMYASTLKLDQMTKEEGSLLSTQRAMYAKAGVTMSGSPTDVALNTATNVEFDKQVVTYNAQVQAKQSQSKANIERMYGQNAQSQSQMKAAGSFLSGAMTLMALA